MRYSTPEQLQNNSVFLPSLGLPCGPISREGPCLQRGRIMFAPPVAVLRQHRKITFAGHDGTEDTPPRLSRDVTDDLGQLHMHLFQGFLHGLNSPRGHLDQQTPRTPRAAPPTDAALATIGHPVRRSCAQACT